jgi:hypothetical protein
VDDLHCMLVLKRCCLNEGTEELEGIVPYRLLVIQVKGWQREVVPLHNFREQLSQ